MTDTPKRPTRSPQGNQTIRTAILTRGRTYDTSLEQIQSYMPGNYSAVEVDVPNGETVIIIVGTDVAGWTLDGYVLPRLASGLHFAQEVTA